MKNNLSVSISEITGFVLSRKRKEMGCNQKEVADKINMSISGLSKIENGTTALSLEQLFVFSEVYNLEPADIVLQITDIITELKKCDLTIRNSKLDKGQNQNQIQKQSYWWETMIEK